MRDEDNVDLLSEYDSYIAGLLESFSTCDLEVIAAATVVRITESLANSELDFSTDVVEQVGAWATCVLSKLSRSPCPSPSGAEAEPTLENILAYLASADARCALSSAQYSLLEPLLSILVELHSFSVLRQAVLRACQLLLQAAELSEDPEGSLDCYELLSLEVEIQIEFLSAGDVREAVDAYVAQPVGR